MMKMRVTLFYTLTPFTRRQSLALSKLKVFADDKLDVTPNIEYSSFKGWKTLWEKEENANYRHFFFFFLLYLQCFQRTLSSEASVVLIVWHRINIKF